MISLSAEELLICPRCSGVLQRVTQCYFCDQCGHNCPVLDGEIIDCLPGYTEVAACWDKEADTDEIYAAASFPKQSAPNIFVKLPPILPTCEFEGKVCVDLGCGYGRTLIYSNINAHPKISIGIDISLVMLRKARAYADQYGVSPILIRADISTLPIRVGTIDLLYSNGVLLHLPKPIVRKAVREVARVLKSNGTAVFEGSFPGWLNPDGIQTKLITNLFSKYLRPAWVRTYRYGEVRRLFSFQERPLRVIKILPEGYRILPKTVLRYSLPRLVKQAVNCVNQQISARLEFKNLSVSCWSAIIQK